MMVVGYRDAEPVSKTMRDRKEMVHRESCSGGTPVRTTEDIKDFLAQSDLDKQRFIEHKQDCDDFALQLHAEAKRYFVKRSVMDNLSVEGAERVLEYPLAFGECFCTKFDRVTAPHNANIAVCEEGVFLIEPQTDAIHKGHPKNDQVLIVRM